MRKITALTITNEMFKHFVAMINNFPQLLISPRKFPKLFSKLPSVTIPQAACNRISKCCPTTDICWGEIQLSPTNRCRGIRFIQNCSSICISSSNNWNISSCTSYSLIILCTTQQAMTIVHCLGILQGGIGPFNAGKCFLRTPNVRSTTFLSDEWRRLNSSLGTCCFILYCILYSP